MKRFFSIIILSIALLLLGTTVSFGAYSAQNKTVNTGESFSVTVTSGEALDAYTLRLTDYSGLTYEGCSKSAGSGEIVECNQQNKVIGYMSASSSTKTLGTFSFKAPDVSEDKTYKVTFSVDGESTVTSTITVKAPKVEPKPEEQPSENTTPSTTTEPEKPTETTPSTTTEPEKPTETTPSTTTEPEKPEETTPSPTNDTQTQQALKKSNNANLKNLGIKPNDFTGFTPGTTSYSVSVPNEISKVEIYAYKAEEKQNVTGTGIKTLSEGSNPFDVVVTAEDGTQKTYKVNVIRLAKEETNNPDVEEPESKVEVALASLQIVSVSLNEAFKPDVYEYTATASPDAKEVIVSGSANVENAVVDIEAPEEYEDGENIIKITVREKNGQDKKVYTVKVSKETAEKEEKSEEITPTAIGSIDNNNSNNNTKQGSGISRDVLIYCIGVAVVALLGIIFAVIRYKKDQKNVAEIGELDFVGDISAKEAIIDAAVTTSRLTNVPTDAATTTSKKGKHF